ncbi:MAG: PTS system mannose/fructose/sorbose family transporter subunit IID, partial [Lachnospiraceae bacterium]|nr:PTS system mannose/fructose/sorbose family transporter subunit IID [Lachnospiraceae bacterium]
LVCTIVKFPINLKLDMQGVPLDFQQILDSIVPGLLPLLLSL